MIGRLWNGLLREWHWLVIRAAGLAAIGMLAACAASPDAAAPPARQAAGATQPQAAETSAPVTLAPPRSTETPTPPAASTPTAACLLGETVFSVANILAEGQYQWPADVIGLARPLEAWSMRDKQMIGDASGAAIIGGAASIANSEWVSDNELVLVGTWVGKGCGYGLLFKNKDGQIVWATGRSGKPLDRPDGNGFGDGVNVIPDPGYPEGEIGLVVGNTQKVVWRDAKGNIVMVFNELSNTWDFVSDKARQHMMADIVIGNGLPLDREYEIKDGRLGEQRGGYFVPRYDLHNKEVVTDPGVMYGEMFSNPDLMPFDVSSQWCGQTDLGTDCDLIDRMFRAIFTGEWKLEKADNPHGGDQVNVVVLKLATKTQSGDIIEFWAPIGSDDLYQMLVVYEYSRKFGEGPYQQWKPSEWAESLAPGTQITLGVREIMKSKPQWSSPDKVYENVFGNGERYYIDNSILLDIMRWIKRELIDKFLNDLFSGKTPPTDDKLRIPIKYLGTCAR